MKRVYAPHIAPIRDALRAIDHYRPVDEATFMDQQMAQDAILMRLQEIGENLARMRSIDDEGFAGVADDSWNQLNWPAQCDISWLPSDQTGADLAHPR